MATLSLRMTLAFVLLAASARGALADIPPQPGPSDPTTWGIVIAIGVAIATGIVYYVRQRGQK